MEKENREESAQEQKGIFKYGKVSAKVFEKEVKKYRAGGLAENQRKALAGAVPKEYETVYKDKIKGYLKGLNPQKFGPDDKRSHAQKAAEINKTKKLLKELMEGD